MELFITWSGEMSKKLGNQFKTWIPVILQAVNPHFSPDDIQKGGKWFTEVSTQLEKTDYGIAMLTSGNIEAPWVMFEAGACAKKLGQGKFCPVLFGIKPTDLKGPLVEFQACVFEKEDIKRLVISLNNSCSNPIAQKTLDICFDKFWPDLEKDVKETLKQFINEPLKTTRPSEEILEEILVRVRSIALMGVSLTGEFNGQVLNDLNTIYNRIVKAFNEKNMFALGTLLEELYMPLSFLGKKTNFDFEKPTIDRNFE